MFSPWEGDRTKEEVQKGEKASKIRPEREKVEEIAGRAFHPTRRTGRVVRVNLAISAGCYKGSALLQLLRSSPTPFNSKRWRRWSLKMCS
jgi:hypothetical protein